MEKTNDTMAAFYAGFAEATFGQDIREDLAICLDKPSQELYDFQGKAIKGLASGDEEAFGKYFFLAETLGKYECADCMEDPDIASVFAQYQLWWDDFWT